MFFVLSRLNEVCACMCAFMYGTFIIYTCIRMVRADIDTDTDVKLPELSTSLTAPLFAANTAAITCCPCYNTQWTNTHAHSHTRWVASPIRQVVHFTLLKICKCAFNKTHYRHHSTCIHTRGPAWNSAARCSGSAPSSMRLCDAWGWVSSKACLLGH